MLFDANGRVFGTIEFPEGVARPKGISVALEAKAQRKPLPKLTPRPIRKPSGGPKPNPVRKPGTVAVRSVLAGGSIDDEPGRAAHHPAGRRARLRAALAAKL